MVDFRYFKREIKSLQAVFTFLNQFFQMHQFNQEFTFALNLAVEEVFTNLVKYNPGNPNRIRIELKKEDNRVVITISDFDVDPFDLTQVQTRVQQLPLAKRPTGGLGLHLVKSVVDQINYDYDKQKRESTITLIKNWREKHVEHSPPKPRSASS